jgi:hypothetical protein
MGDETIKPECITTCRPAIITSILFTILIVGIGSYLLFSWQLSNITGSLEEQNEDLNQQISQLRSELLEGME